MRRVLSRCGMLLCGVLALLLSGTPDTVRADDDTPKRRSDPTPDVTRHLEMFRKLMEDRGMPHFGMHGFRTTNSHPRLGAEVMPPDGALVDQLDLPKDKGLVLGKVAPNSAAAKAGLKPHDILLELNGKAVTSNVSEFRKFLAGVEANKPVDAVVLRKGKKETVKGLKLPEAKAVAANPLGDFPALPNFPKFEGFGNFENLLPPAAGNADSTVVTRNNDQFTVTRKSGKSSVTVKGKIDQGKAKVENVTIDDGNGKKTYDSLSKVPAAHKKQVEDLLEMVAGKGDPSDTDL